MHLGGWLRSLGLEQYEAAFRENAIDDTVLHDLKEDHLREIGIPLGARLKLLKAIAALGTGAEATRPSADAVSPGPPVDAAERRQVTVMFSDLVGSTALAAGMDPEDLREVISAYQKCVAETVRRFDGFVAKYLGDGVLVYFGYPQAHEDDAERAVRAGLELIAAVTGLKTHALLQTRVGIATGLVVVGDLIGSGEAQERGIVGETPNLAARLQGAAERAEIVAWLEQEIRRAARFGVSPTMPRSSISPDPIRSPTTTSPVAIPTRVCSEARVLRPVVAAISSSPARIARSASSSCACG